jgi:hypothetical protein
VLHLDKETYERAGIVGKPDGVKGKRGTKPRWGMFSYFFEVYVLNVCSG